MGKKDDGITKEGNISLGNPKSESFGKDGVESIEARKKTLQIFSKYVISFPRKLKKKSDDNKF